MLKKVESLFWSYLPSALALALFVIVGGIYFFTGLLSPDLGGNLFAEAFGIFFTVTLLEIFIRANRRRETRAARFAAFQESNRLLTYICGTWADIVKSTIAAPAPVGSDFFSQTFVDEVAQHFDLTSTHQGILPEQSWHAYLQAAPQNVANSVEKIIGRYQLVLDAELLELLLKVEKLPFIMIWSQFGPIVTYGGRSPRALPIPSDMVAEFDVLRDFHRTLKARSAEFSRMAGYIQVYDISFNSATKLMNERSDLGPSVGSSRR